MADPALPVEPIVAAPAPIEAAPAPPAVVEAPAAVSAEPAAVLVADRPSLLETIAKVDVKSDLPAVIETEAPKTEGEAKPAEAKSVEAKPEPKPAEGEKPKEAVAESLPKDEWKPDYKFEMPAVIKDSPKEMGDFTTILGDSKVPVEAGQKLLNLHATAMENFAKAYNEQALATQHRVFNEMRDEWNRQARADPEIGGAGHQTAMRAIARMRDLFVPEDDRAAFDQFLRITGAGDHPAFLKAFHRAARYFDEPALPPPGAKPTKTNGQRPGANVLYDNPRSNIGGQQ